jgi:hypothetical protein
MEPRPELAGTGKSTSRAPGAARTGGGHTKTKITGGGPAGNEQLTSITGTILLVLLAAIGVTIVRIGQLLWLHLFLGLLLIGP